MFFVPEKSFLFLFVKVPVFRPMDLMVEASPRRVFANAHTYHINSISVNSDCETYLSADDLRINLWNLEITDRSFSILLLFISTQPPSSIGLLHIISYSHRLWSCLLWKKGVAKLTVPGNAAVQACTFISLVFLRLDFLVLSSNCSCYLEIFSCWFLVWSRTCTCNTF